MVLTHLEPFFKLFLTQPCPLCDRPGQPLLCLDCQQQLQDCRLPPTAARSSATLSHCADSIVSLGHYGGLLKRAIAQLKYHNSPALAQPLGEGLAETWLQKQPKPSRGPGLSPPRPWVLPVPMHPEKQRQRGFNQAELIARSFCRRTGLPLKAAGLQRIQATRPQFELSPAERQRNVAQAFALGPDLQTAGRKGCRRPVLLLDDIYTTGATVNGIAQILAAAQIPLAGVVVVARAME